MKSSVSSYEKRLGLTRGTIHHWISGGTLPLKRSRDQKLELSNQELVMLISISSYFKACGMGVRTGIGGTGLAKNLKYYWTLLAEGFRCWKIAKKHVPPEVEIKLWTYFRDGFPHVSMTRDGVPVEKNAVNLGEAVKQIGKDLKTEPLEKVHPRYELTIDKPSIEEKLKARAGSAAK